MSNDDSPFDAEAFFKAADEARENAVAALHSCYDITGKNVSAQIIQASSADFPGWWVYVETESEIYIVHLTDDFKQGTFYLKQSRFEAKDD